MSPAGARLTLLAFLSATWFASASRQEDGDFQVLGDDGSIMLALNSSENMTQEVSSIGTCCYMENRVKAAFGRLKRVEYSYELCPMGQVCRYRFDKCTQIIAIPDDDDVEKLETKTEEQQFCEDQMLLYADHVDARKRVLEENNKLDELDMQRRIQDAQKTRDAKMAATSKAAITEISAMPKKVYADLSKALDARRVQVEKDLEEMIKDVRKTVREAFTTFKKEAAQHVKEHDLSIGCESLNRGYDDEGAEAVYKSCSDTDKLTAYTNDIGASHGQFMQTITDAVEKFRSIADNVLVTELMNQVRSAKELLAGDEFLAQVHEKLNSVITTHIDETMTVKEEEVDIALEKAKYEEDIRYFLEVGRAADTATTSLVAAGKASCPKSGDCCCYFSSASNKKTQGKADAVPDGFIGWKDCINPGPRGSHHSIFGKIGRGFSRFGNALTGNSAIDFFQSERSCQKRNKCGNPKYGRCNAGTNPDLEPEQQKKLVDFRSEQEAATESRQERIAEQESINNKAADSNVEWKTQMLQKYTRTFEGNADRDSDNETPEDIDESDKETPEGIDEI